MLEGVQCKGLFAQALEGKAWKKAGGEGQEKDRLLQFDRELRHILESQGNIPVVSIQHFKGLKIIFEFIKDTKRYELDLKSGK